jgi:hypothetical protein
MPFNPEFDNITKDEMENARITYQSCLDLLGANTSTIWSIFNAMVVANSIVFATIGLLINNPQFKFFLICFCFFGLLVCIGWILITARSFCYQDHWILSARGIGNKYFNPDISRILNKGPNCKNSIFSQIKARILIFFTICVFIGLYAISIYIISTQ